MALRFSRLRASVACVALLAGSGARAEPGLLFSLSGDKGSVADFAAGGATPIFAKGVTAIADGKVGAGFTFSDDLVLAWPGPGNIYAQRGTLSFFFRSRTPFGTTPFPIFRVGGSDGSSWDMVFLRIDWNGHGYDAFVTDTGLARTRISYRIASIPAANAWTHIAFGWDERSGVKLWVDGQRVATLNRKAVYDAGLFGFGPFQRVVSPWQVHTRRMYSHGGDLDEIRIYDHMLDDASVATLATAGTPNAPAAPPAPAMPTDDPQVRQDWWHRYGWAAADIAPLYLSAASIRIRKVEFSDARDQKEKMARGTDGIRETTWPGVYNRSRLPGRHDYFELPDWNVYATGGQAYTLTLPDEPWNRIEIAGPAYGDLQRTDGDGAGLLFRRPEGLERSSTPLDHERHGGTIRFDNVAQETPIEEIGAYDVTAGEAPAADFRLHYRIDAKADPASYPALDGLAGYIAGRFVPQERATVVALPAGAPRKPRAAVAAPASTPASTPPSASASALPIVHILVPGDFRDARLGNAPQRFTYGAANLNMGLDGVAIHLPALPVQPTHRGLLPLNIRIKDPTWPDRDLLDVDVAVKPGEARTLWLDTRDRILPDGASMMIDIAAAGGGFDMHALDGTDVDLLYKPVAAAKAEHVADRLAQARDELSWLVEEQPSTRLYPVWTRFERDISDVLRVDPGNATARAYWVEKEPEQPYAPMSPEPAPPPGVPAWAWRQSEDLKLYQQFVDWWIDHRQIADGEFGGGLSDDTDLVNQWVPLAMMGVEPERIAASQRRVLDATFANGMWSNGLGRIRTDELHSYEEGINTLGQAMLLDWGDPSAIERSMAVARNYPKLMQVNPAGHAHVVSSLFSGTSIVREAALGWQEPYSLLITHPGLMLVDYNGAPATKALLLSVLDGWLAHGKKDANGVWQFPSNIEWASDKATGKGVASAGNSFWAAYDWTGDERYLRPIATEMAEHDLAGLSALNADLLARTPQGPALAKAIADGTVKPDGGAIDRNLGGFNDRDYARFVHWQQTGDKNDLVALYDGEIASDRGRMPVLTDAELWVDRVSVPSELLQRTRMGGVAHRRNAYYPGNLVRWHFAAPARGEDVALLIPHGDPRHFRIIGYNLTDRPITARMTGDEVAAGRWRLSAGIDTDGDDRADTVGEQRDVTLERGAGVDIAFPPHQTIVYDFTLATPGDDPAARPDIGLSGEDLALRGDRLSVTAHSLGAKATPGGTAIVEDAAGHVVARAPIPPLAAPTDLEPKTATVAIRLPHGTPTPGLRVRLTLDGDPAETSATNNVAALGVTIASQIAGATESRDDATAQEDTK
ncbi:LamG-like jellyroll fold domain-containing protein [Sphingomonas abietis]|uniref:LamG domain-containing protein n=1 Tax=Sphingomonas abietis TaxID=3012344 RepID=A0ABY7NQC2_9SPHN|nr:LamG-like jellyroll fold domain-containing protein [Sphingomonas abietis]WBO23740.1 LamG domain-containing protein [Sphingomonas abietis]